MQILNGVNFKYTNLTKKVAHLFSNYLNSSIDGPADCKGRIIQVLPKPEIPEKINRS